MGIAGSSVRKGAEESQHRLNIVILVAHKSCGIDVGAVLNCCPTHEDLVLSNRGKLSQWITVHHVAPFVGEKKPCYLDARIGCNRDIQVDAAGYSLPSREVLSGQNRELVL